MLDTSSFSHKRIVLTGAGGYVAHGIIQLLQGVECTIVRFTRTEKRPTTGERATFVDIIGDYTRAEDVDRAIQGADVVFHLAAQTSVYRADADPLQDQENNLRPVLALLQGCARNGVSADFLLAGTATEVGLPDAVVVSEAQADRPVSVYDLHKLIAEMYVAYFARVGVVCGTTLRLPNIYGPGPISGSADRGVLNLMMRRGLAGEPLTIYGQGEEIRDYLHVTDVARAFLLAASAMNNMNTKHYVLGSGHGSTVAQAIHLVADRVEVLTGLRPPVVHVDPPPGLSPIEKRSFVADASRFRADTGWEPSFSLTDGIDQSLQAMLQAGRIHS